MNILKLFGFTVDEQHTLGSHIPAEYCDIGQVETWALAPSPEEIWVVSVAAAEAFIKAAHTVTKTADHWRHTVLWVPKGRSPLAFAHWGSRFGAQLFEASEGDRDTLARLSRCAQTIEWGQRVAAVPAAWFAKLTGSPQQYQIEALPFSPDDIQHLHRCAVCQKEAYMRLQQRATLRWTLLCPSVEDLTTWLEVEDEEPEIEAHVMDCGLCQETVQWQARLWERERLLPAAHVHAKLATLGLLEPSATVWLTTACAWQQIQAQAAVVVWGALVAAALGHVVRLVGPAARSAGIRPEAPDMTVEALTARLAVGERITGFDADHWLHVEVAEDTILLRVGNSPADPFTHFRVEFQQGDDVVVTVEAEDGVVRLRPEHFQQAQRGQADRLRILRPIALRR